MRCSLAADYSTTLLKGLHLLEKFINKFSRSSRLIEANQFLTRKSEQSEKNRICPQKNIFECASDMLKHMNLYKLNKEPNINF